MRKLTVSVKPNLFMRKMLKEVFEQITSIELKELMKLDFSNGKKIGVGELTLKEGYELDQIKTNGKFEILDILSKNKNKYTCLIKVNVPKSGKRIFDFFDFDLIYDVPTVMTCEKLTYSVIGTEKNLQKFLKLLKFIGSVEKVAYRQADYRGVGLTQSLTEKQNYILTEAIKLGYYSYPRKINTTDLAKKIGISRTTLVEHLRKSENRIIKAVLID